MNQLTKMNPELQKARAHYDTLPLHVKDLFWELEDWVVQFHPAQSEYVNHHPGCLHLWRPLVEKLPTPLAIMVGPKPKFRI
jgi:hypothetical protein